MRIVGVVPARSGSRGVPDKNVRRVCGLTLIERAIVFGQALELDDVVVTTDSPAYADIARSAGATVPGLRGAAASGDTAMEPSVIDDLDNQLALAGLPSPDIAVWIRPTFVFRSLSCTRECIQHVQSGSFSSSRVVTRVDPRIYADSDGRLVPQFEDSGASMVRRQGLSPLFHVFNVDVFPWPSAPCPNDYLGRNVGYSVAPSLCSVDIDAEDDLAVAEALLSAFRDGILP